MGLCCGLWTRSMKMLDRLLIPSLSSAQSLYMLVLLATQGWVSCSRGSGLDIDSFAGPASACGNVFRIKAHPGKLMSLQDLGGMYRAASFI